MSRAPLAIAVVASLLVVGPAAVAEEKGAPPALPAQSAPLALDFESALARARQSSPAALTGGASVKEAAASRAEAEIYPRQNPVLDLALGPRVVSAPESVFLSVGLSQSLDLGGGVSARVRRVEALTRKAQAGGDAALQETLRGVALSFLRGLWAEERLALSSQTVAISKSVLDSTKKRLEASDATALELNVAKGGHARAIADRSSAEAARDLAHGELRVLLGLPASRALVLKGSLEQSHKKTSSVLQSAAKNRADLRASAAELDAAEADVDLAGVLAAPQLSVGARYEHEDKMTHTFLGTIAITLPIFDHGQGLSTQAQASAARAKGQLEVRCKQIATEIQTHEVVTAKRADAVNSFDEQGGLKSLQDNVALASKGYAAGELSLGEVMLMRRELIDTESSRIDRLLELRLAEIELLFSAGAL